MPRMIQVIGLITFIVLVALLWAGLLRPMQVKEVQNDKIYGIYIVHHGELYKIPDAINDVKQYADDKGISYTSTFGRYFQDPKTTPSELLTSWVGVIVEDPVEVEKPFKLMEIDARDNVYVKFRGYPFFAPFRTYSKINTYMSRRNYDLGVPSLEIYTPVGYGQTIIDIYREIVEL